MNSNILILNKLISKFILDRPKKFDVENLAIFFNFQKNVPLLHFGVIFDFIFEPIS